MDVLAFPFRIDPNGQVPLVTQGSEAHLAQQAYQFVSTRPGEVTLAPAYGLYEPMFRIVNKGEIITGMAQFHPDVDLVSVDIRATPAEGTYHIGIEFGARTGRIVPAETEVIFGA
jgi:hypothetical protein